MTDPRMRQYSQNKCYCGAWKFSAVRFCRDCQAAHEERQRRERQIRAEFNQSRYRNYVILHDPTPDGFRKGASFSRDDMVDLVRNEYIPRDTILFDKRRQVQLIAGDLTG